MGGPLTWGVCRQDARNQLNESDVVVFFSYLKFEDTGDSEYRLCALATVQRKASQIQLWDDPKLRNLTKYFNLLIRPFKLTPGGWEHYEPTLNGDKERIHGDWLWRISDHSGLRKKHFDKLEKTNHFYSNDAVKRQTVAVARNYVIFSMNQAETRVLSRPLIVAYHSKMEHFEPWKRDRFSQRIKELTLDRANQVNGRKRWLRIRNSQRAHRHIVFELPAREAGDWRADFFHLIGQR